MFLTKQHLTTARALGVAIVATLSLAACATKDDIAAINTRLDRLDSSVQSANDSAQRANQRLDQMEGRIQRLETQPARVPRG